MGRLPTIDELENAIREVGLGDEPEEAGQVTGIKNLQKVLKAAKLLIEASSLLHELRQCGGDMENEAIRGFREMADLAIDGLDQCREESVAAVASKQTTWSVMLADDPTIQESAVAHLKQIKLGNGTFSDVRLHAIVTQSSRLKSVAAMLFLTVRAMYNLERLARVADQPERMARLRDDMGTKYKMLMRLVNGYEASEWRDKDLKTFAKRIKGLHAVPESPSPRSTNGLGPVELFWRFWAISTVMTLGRTLRVLIGF